VPFWLHLFGIKKVEIETHFFFHLFLDEKVEPKINHGQSRCPARAGPQHRLPEPGASALAVDTHRTLYLSVQWCAGRVCDLRTTAKSFRALILMARSAHTFDTPEDGRADLCAVCG